jgi:hypothetical protein
MKAKRTFAVSVACGVLAVLVVLAFGAVYLRNGPSTVASDPIEDRAQMAVRKARVNGKTRPVPLTDEQRALGVIQRRSQIEAIEKEKIRKQDEARVKRLARKAAAARAYELGKAAVSSRRERASRDAERARLEAERRKYEGTPREVARRLLADHGWSDGQWPCLDSLWTRESGWRYDADNPTSSAYGIPQALPGNRMAEYGADWRTNPVTQIKWGLDYIQDAYGSPCSAWDHSQATGWY